MSRWWRCYEGAPFDPKWRVVAVKIGGRPGDVWAVASALHDHASKNDGSIEDIDLEEIAVAFGYDLDFVTDVTVTLRDKCFIVDDRIATWDERQYRDDSAPRVRAFRQRQKERKNNSLDRSETDVTVTPFHGNGETPSDQIRSDQNPPIAPPGGFERFWKIYPHKVGEPSARRAFDHAIEGATVDEILAGVARYVAAKSPTASWKNPAGWLRERRWRDHPAPTGGGKVAAFVASGPRRTYQEILDEKKARERGGDPRAPEPISAVQSTILLPIEGKVS